MAPDQKSDNWWFGQYVDTRNTKSAGVAHAFLEAIPPEVIGRIGEGLLLFERLRQQGKKKNTGKRGVIWKILRFIKKSL